MTALVANVGIPQFVDKHRQQYGVAAAAHIFKGGFVGLRPDGVAKAFEPGDLLVGVAYDESDNTALAAVDGDTNIIVVFEGDFVFPVAGANDGDVGKAVYATDDATAALTGHPDAFIGTLIGTKETDIANGVTIRLKNPGQDPPVGQGSTIAQTDFREFISGVTANVFNGQFELDALVGLGIETQPGTRSSVIMAFDAQAEIARASIASALCFPITSGFTFEATLHMPDIGDANAVDFDFGVVNAITDNIKADLASGDLTKHCVFHMDGNSENILASSDDNISAIAAVDTNINNDEAADAFKRFKIVGRPSGLCEVWIDRVRVIPATVLSVGSAAGNIAAYIGLEKTSNDTLASVRIARLRMAGAAI